MVILAEGHEPDLYLIPSVDWQQPSSLLVGRNYEGLKSQPEWGLNLSKKNKTILDGYRFENVIQKMLSIRQTTVPVTPSALGL